MTWYITTYIYYIYVCIYKVYIQRIYNVYKITFNLVLRVACDILKAFRTKKKLAIKTREVGSIQKLYTWNSVLFREFFRSSLHNSDGSDCFSTKDMQTPTPSPLLRNGHLDIKDAQWARKMMGEKFHIISYHVWTSQAPKHAQTAPQKFKFLQKWANLQGSLEFI